MQQAKWVLIQQQLADLQPLHDIPQSGSNGLLLVLGLVHGLDSMAPYGWLEIMHMVSWHKMTLQIVAI
jgi:hypothetical protein